MIDIVRRLCGRGLEIFWLFFVGTILGYAANFIVVISGVWFLDLFIFSPRLYTLAITLLTVFSSIAIPTFVMVFVGERIGRQIKSGKGPIFALTFLGAVFPVVIALLLPPDAKFGLIGGIAVLAYFLSPLCASIAYNFGRCFLSWKALG